MSFVVSALTWKASIDLEQLEEITDWRQAHISAKAAH